jgi:hypothetical protein
MPLTVARIRNFYYEITKLHKSYEYECFTLFLSYKQHAVTVCGGGKLKFYPNTRRTRVAIFQLQSLYSRIKFLCNPLGRRLVGCGSGLDTVILFGTEPRLFVLYSQSLYRLIDYFPTPPLLVGPNIHLFIHLQIIYIFIHLFWNKTKGHNNF